jgi:hypothetical protein
MPGIYHHRISRCTDGRITFSLGPHFNLFLSLASVLGLMAFLLIEWRAQDHILPIYLISAIIRAPGGRLELTREERAVEG